MILYRLNWWPKSVRPDSSNDEYWDTMIHFNDLHLLESNFSSGNIFCLISEEKDYLKVSNGTISIRINQITKDDCLKLIIYEGLFINDFVLVKTLNGKNTECKGVISYMFYHFKFECIVYHIKDESGNSIKKRYYKEDLLKLVQH